MPSVLVHWRHGGIVGIVGSITGIAGKHIQLSSGLSTFSLVPSTVDRLGPVVVAGFLRVDYLDLRLGQVAADRRKHDVSECRNEDVVLSRLRLNGDLVEATREKHSVPQRVGCSHGWTEKTLCEPAHSSVILRVVSTRMVVSRLDVLYVTCVRAVCLAKPHATECVANLSESETRMVVEPAVASGVLFEYG